MEQNDYQFGGLPNDDPYKNITNFLEICDTQQHNGVLVEKVRLIIFSFSLRDKVRIWFKSLPKELIATWEEMVKKFSQNTFHPQNHQNFKVISQPLPNLILNLFMMLGKGTRT